MGIKIPGNPPLQDKVQNGSYENEKKCFSIYFFKTMKPF
jgi:hypothetical protein